MEQRKKQKSKFSLRKLIYNDKYLIIISILIALVIWIITAINLSPQTTKTISVPVTVDFSDSAADQLGIKCFGDKKFEVDVTVSCKKYLAMDITADDIDVSLQTNTVTTKGSQEVPIKVSVGENADFSVSSYYPTVYRAYFDVEDEKAMKIELDYNNKDFIQEGYVMGEPLLSESSVLVKGPKSYVSQVTKVVSYINIDEKINKTQTLDLTLNALSNSGSNVDYISLDTGSENLTLTIPVLKEYNLPVSTSFVGKPEKLNTDSLTVKYSVDNLNVGVLEDADIETVNIGNIDFSKLNKGDNEFTFNVAALDGIVVLDDVEEITATVTVPSNFDTKRINIKSTDVNVTNIPEGYEARVTSISTSTVTAVGPESQVKELKSGDVSLIVDLSAYENSIKTGSAECTLTVLPAASKTCWAYGDYTASVVITKA